MSLWGGVVVGVGLGYPMLLYYVCHEEMFAPRWSRRGGVLRVGHLHFQNNRRFGASLVVARRSVPFLRG